MMFNPLYVKSIMASLKCGYYRRCSIQPRKYGKQYLQAAAIYKLQQDTLNLSTQSKHKSDINEQNLYDVQYGGTV